METKKLKKSSNKMLLGVCSGYAEYLGVDPTVIRIALVLLSLFVGCGLIFYIISALIMPGE